MAATHRLDRAELAASVARQAGMRSRIDVSGAHGVACLEPRRPGGWPVVSPRAVSLHVIQCQLAVQPNAGPQGAAGGDLVLTDKSVSHDLSLQRAKPARIVRG